MANESLQHAFVVCVDDAGVEDVSCGVVYRVLPDPKAASEGYLRIVDDSGEDYLYPRERFVAIDVPVSDSDRLTAACSPR
jgi:hypothetical protein